MVNILQNNPYRLLGVYSNSPTRERVANHNRIKAFLKVGKSVSFPLDLPQYLPAPNRTEASVDEAEAKLALPKDQIAYAQFWFVKATPFDEIAFKNLQTGDISKAEEIWLKRECASSLQNLVVHALICGKHGSAIAYAETLYGNAQYTAQFADAINGTGASTDAKSLAFSFLDTLCNEIGANTLLPFVTNGEWKSHIGEKSVKPLVESIQAAIDTAKKSRNEGPEARLKAGKLLRESTRSTLLQLREFLPKTDLQYQMTADKLGLEILQCGIDYYNKSKEEEAAYKAIELIRYAQSIVVGKMAKDRCNENASPIEEYIRVLPAYKAILAILDAFALKPQLIEHSIQLMKDCVPYVVAIKEELGSKHTYYLAISTKIVDNAIGNVIAEVNKALSNGNFSVLKKTLANAWHAQVYMDKFDLLPEYKDGRFKQNRNALHNIIKKYDGFSRGGIIDIVEGSGWAEAREYDEFDLRTDNEYFLSCRNSTQFRAYVKRFPNGKHLAQAKTKIEELSFREAKTIADFRKFVNEFPNSPFEGRAKAAINNLVQKENERKERIARQEQALAACRSIKEVYALYQREKASGINKSAFSLKAFELATTKQDYLEVTTLFGHYSSGGAKAQARIQEMEEKLRKRRIRRKYMTRLIMLTIPVLIAYLIGGGNGIAMLLLISAPAVVGILAFLATRSRGVHTGFAYFTGIITFLAMVPIAVTAPIVLALENEQAEKTAQTEVPTAKGAPEHTEDLVDSVSDSALVDVSEDDDLFEDSDYSDYDTYINNQLPTGAKPYKAYYRTRTGENYLDFKTSGNDYVIIVRDYKTSKVVNHVYVQADDCGRLYLPNGTYNIYFYGGKGWNPTMENGNVVGGFVSGGTVSKDGPVRLYDEYGEYTLYPVRNGNLHLESATINEAF